MTSPAPCLTDLVWCTPHPVHYNTFLFERLAQIEGIRLTVVYFDRQLAAYPWKTVSTSLVAPVYLRRWCKVDWRFFFERLTHRRELMVIAGWNEPTMLMLLVTFAVLGRPYVIWSDTPNLRQRTGAKAWLRRRVLDLVLRNAYRFLVTGQPGIDAVRALGLPPERLVNFPFATDTTVFHPASARDAEPGIITCISSGRLDNSHKAYDVAIEAFLRVKARNPQLRFRYVIAGDGPDRDAIKALIRQHGLSDDVVLRGWLESNELPEFYRSADVLIHSSNFDPFPNAVLEAMASGLPVVGSRAAGSVQDRVVDGYNGFVHAPGNANELGDVLTRFLLMPIESRRQLGIHARQTALQWHVDYHANVIRSLVSEFASLQHGN
jgi:glycosyltransferase involved in cell wall biosynthesis